MRRVLICLAPAALFAAAGCPQQQAAAPPSFCQACDIDNPINASLLPSFRALKVEPKIATPRELCARLAVDLLGRPMSADEADATCSGRPLDEVVLEMQGTDDYLVTSERHWANRFQLNDVVGDWRSLKDLYGLVDQMQRGELDYAEFAIEAIAHPGLMTDLTDLDARGRVRRVFRTFMGRPSTEAEEAELAALFREWLVRYDADPDFPVLYRYTPVITPGLCEPLARCSTTMLGGAALEFPESVRTNYDGIAMEDLDDATRAVLRVPGELFVSQPTFAEAAADDILNRFLDWDEGERDLRTPGFLFPEVRQVIADYLTDTGDYPGAERMVLTSWLYTQTSDVKDGVSVDDDGADPPPPLLVGPSKSVPAEVWLAGLQQVTSYDMGGCDNRYGDGFPYFQLLQAVQDGTITAQQNNEMAQRLFDMREDRGRLTPFNGVLVYDTTYTQYARMLGGCPGFQATRQKPAGVSYAILQEGIAQAFCAPGVDDLAVPGGDVTPRSVMEHLVPLMLSRPATDDDVAAIEAAAPPGVSKDELISEACTAIAGSAEFLFR